MIPQLLDKSMIDSVYVSHIPPVESYLLPNNNVLDMILAIAMAIIAVVNIGLTIYIFRTGRKDSSKSELMTRQFELLQTLVLNSNIDRLYDFYKSVAKHCEALMSHNDRTTKKKVNDAVIAEQAAFRRDFITLISVVDKTLSQELKVLTDSLVDGITEAIFDEGVNLKHKPKFEELISQSISKNRVDFLSKLYKIADLQ